MPECDALTLPGLSDVESYLYFPADALQVRWQLEPICCGAQS
jgi:hypothetical protein